MVIIKDLELPKTCSECPFEWCSGIGYGCDLVDDDLEVNKIREIKRLDNCPLRDVDNHYIKIIATYLAVYECDETSESKCFECINKIKGELMNEVS